MNHQYQIVAFDITRPDDEPHSRFVSYGQYAKIKDGWDQIELKHRKYQIVATRYFTQTSELFGNRTMIIVDIKPII